MSDQNTASPLFKVSRKGKEIGEYDAESIQSMLASGILNGTEHCWQVGFKNWVPLASMFEVATKPEEPTTEENHKEAARPPAAATPGGKLLSPTVIANLSLLFGPFWGAYFVSKNWEAAGEGARARSSMLWLTIGLPVSVAAWFATGVPATFPWIISGVLGLLPTLAWYYMDAKKQMTKFKADGIEVFGASWITPIVIGLTILSGIIFLGVAWEARK
jgi:hypothetical protein